MKVDHTSLEFKKQQKPNKTYKDLRQNQKKRIAIWMYTDTLRFYRTNARMPDEQESRSIVTTIFERIEAAKIWVPFDEVMKQYNKRKDKYESRVLVEERDPEDLLPKPMKKPGEGKLRQRKKKRKRKVIKKTDLDSYSDGNFAFIAGYTSGGAPYGITWEEWDIQNGK